RQLGFGVVAGERKRPQIAATRAEIERMPAAAAELRADLQVDELHEVDEVGGRPEDRLALAAGAEIETLEQRVVPLEPAQRSLGGGLDVPGAQLFEQTEAKVEHRAERGAVARRDLERIAPNARRSRVVETGRLFEVGERARRDRIRGCEPRADGANRIVD